MPRYKYIYDTDLGNWLLVKNGLWKNNLDSPDVLLHCGRFIDFAILDGVQTVILKPKDMNDLSFMIDQRIDVDETKTS